MTDKDSDSGSQERRSVLKAFGIGGLAATGLSATAGTAAAQNKKAVAEITSVQDLVQDGDQTGTGLIVVQVQNVNVSDVLDVAVAIGDDVINVEDIEVLNNNNVEIAVTDTVDVAVGSVQVAVTLLGTTVQDASNMFAVGDTTTITQ